MNEQRSSRRVWPPPQTRFRWTVVLAMVFGALEGVIVGSLYGAYYEFLTGAKDRCSFGAIGGLSVGWMYGAVTGWAIYRVWWWLGGHRWVWVWRAVVGLLGSVLIGGSAAALAYIGDTHAFWSPPLPLTTIPFFLGVLAWLAEEFGLGNEGFVRVQRPLRIINLRDPTTCAPYDLDKFWFLVLLLALRDSADEIWLEPDDDGHKLRFRMNDAWRDLVPPPSDLAAQSADYIRNLANLEVRNWRLDWLMRRIAFLPPRFSQHGVLPLRFGNEALTAVVSIQAAPGGEVVILRLRDHSVAADQVERLLQTLVAKREPAPETGINHVCQGQGNCAIATLAMIAGITYTEADAALPSFPKCRRGWVKAYLKALERFTRKRWQPVPLYSLPRRLDGITFPDWPVIVLICPRRRWRSTHCITVKGRFVHDPSLTRAVPIDRYCRGDWRVSFALQPRDP